MDPTNVHQSAVNRAAFCTIVGLGGATIASVIAAATAASTISTIAFAILAVGGVAVSTGAITAWINSDGKNVSEYFDDVKSHSAMAFAGFTQFIAQTLVLAIIQGVKEGVTDLIYSKISRQQTQRHRFS